MSVHLLAVLGPSLYEPVFYYYGEEFRSDEQEFIQLVLAKQFRDELKQEGSRVTVFLTQKAKNLNWESRNYTAKEAENAQNWVSKKKCSVVEGGFKKGLKDQFMEQLPEIQVEVVDIEEAQTSEQIDSVFSSIYNSIGEDEEIIFDITHSFRSIPLLAMTVINYAKIMKNCRLRGIYYGAYEAGEKNEIEGKKVAPINNLTSYNDILEWSFAANAFMRFGNASMIRELFNEKLDSIPSTEKKNWADIRKTMKMAGCLSDAIQTGRGADSTLLKRKRAPQEVSVKTAYEEFAKSLTENGENRAREIQPFYHLLEKIKEEFEIFDKKHNYEVGIAVAQWSIENDMIQQGFTALEETIKTYLCDRYGLNEIDHFDREIIVNGMLTTLQKQLGDSEHSADYSNSEGRMEILNGESGKALREKVLAAENSELRLKALEEMFYDDNMTLVMVSQVIKEGRNDINHFGMRLVPKSSSDLAALLKKSFVEFKAFVEMNPIEDR